MSCGMSCEPRPSLWAKRRAARGTEEEGVQGGGHEMRQRGGGQGLVLPQSRSRSIQDGHGIAKKERNKPLPPSPSGGTEPAEWPPNQDAGLPQRPPGGGRGPVRPPPATALARQTGVAGLAGVAGVAGEGDALQ